MYTDVPGGCREETKEFEVELWHVQTYKCHWEGLQVPLGGQLGGGSAGGGCARSHSHDRLVFVGVSTDTLQTRPGGSLMGA